MKIHKFPFTIAYADTDAEGIVYHARYLEIAERARMHWLRGRVSDGDDIGFVVRELDIKYLQPLRVSDDCVVETVLTDAGRASFKVEQKIMKDNQICAIMNLKVAYLGGDMRPKQIPEDLIQQLI